MTNLQIIALALLLAIGLTTILPVAASADVLGSALKIFGIGYVVSHFGPQINSFINNLAGQKGVKWDGLTKVVPIISVGSGTYVGAAQVQGAQDRVSEVKAVGQVETRISGLGARLLVPVGTTSIKKGTNLTRIQGVGVSGLIDFKI
jgi:hypothetical protein